MISHLFFLSHVQPTNHFSSLTSAFVTTFLNTNKRLSLSHFSHSFLDHFRFASELKYPHPCQILPLSLHLSLYFSSLTVALHIQIFLSKESTVISEQLHKSPFPFYIFMVIVIYLHTCKATYTQEHAYIFPDS